MNDPVSVFIPTYNAARFIRKAIESVLAQTHPHFELIVIDNASTDETPDIVRHYAALDARVRLIQNETNIGFQRSVNRALRAARYEYIAKLDAPDWMPSHRLAEQKSFLDAHSDVAVIGGDCEFYDEQYRFLHLIRFSDYYLPVELLFGCRLSHSAVMYRKSVVMNYGGYDERLVRAEDYDLWTKLLADGYRLENLPKVMSCELVFSGQGADFHKEEEWDAVRCAQLRILCGILDNRLTPNAEQIILGLATDNLCTQVSSEEVYTCARYFCNRFFDDLQAFYPYALDPCSKRFLQERLRAFIQKNLFNRGGRAALRAARAEGLNVSPLITSKVFKMAVRRTLGNLRKGFYTFLQSR